MKRRHWTQRLSQSLRMYTVVLCLTLVGEYETSVREKKRRVKMNRRSCETLELFRKTREATFSNIVRLQSNKIYYEEYSY